MKSTTTSGGTGSTLSKPLGGGLSGFGKKKEDENNVDENSKLADCIPEVSNQFVDVFASIDKYTKIKPLEGVESFDRKLSVLLSDSQKVVQHKLISLANEIGHGASAISEARGELEMFHNDKAYLGKVHNFPTPFMSKFVKNLDVRAKNLSEVVIAFESSLQTSSQVDNPVILIQSIEELYQGIIRCAAKVAQVKKQSENVREKLVNYYRRNNSTKINMVQKIDYSDEQNSLSKEIQQSYQQFLDERKRNLEKRDTVTKFADLCAPTAQKSTLLGNKTGLLGNAAKTASQPKTGTGGTGVLGQSK